MVHTRPLNPSADCGQLPLLACAAMSSEPHFPFLRPGHAQYPDRSESFFVRKQRSELATPGVVTRVAVADDTDPFTDLGIGEVGCRMQGSWVGGVWVGRESQLPPADRKVAEGRIMGYSIWQRCWPKNPEAARHAKSRVSGIWPQDNFRKKIDRALYVIMDRFWGVASPDPSEDPEHIQEFVVDGGRQYLEHIKHITEQLDGTTGYIYCFAVAVDPSFQRRGIGAHLMRWGLERAEREGAPILLTSTPKGAGLYEKLGFETLGVMAVNNGNIRENTMIYWPKQADRIEPKLAGTIQRDSRGRRV